MVVAAALFVASRDVMERDGYRRGANQSMMGVRGYGKEGGICFGDGWRGELRRAARPGRDGCSFD